MPGRDHSIEVQDLRLQRPLLRAESSQARARNLGEPLVACVSDDMEQFLDTVAPDRRDDETRRDGHGSH